MIDKKKVRYRRRKEALRAKLRNFRKGVGGSTKLTKGCLPQQITLRLITDAQPLRGCMRAPRRSITRSTSTREANSRDNSESPCAAVELLAHHISIQTPVNLDPWKRRFSTAIGRQGSTPGKYQRLGKRTHRGCPGQIGNRETSRTLLFLVMLGHLVHERTAEAVHAAPPLPPLVT